MSRNRSKRAPTPNPLSPAQREIMEIVWEFGEVSASQVREMLSNDREVARNTVRTLLERMEAKGWLDHRVEGRSYIYFAAIPRHATIGQNVQDIVDNLCRGRPERLVAALLDYRGLNAFELRKIQKLLEEASKKSRMRG